MKYLKISEIVTDGMQTRAKLDAEHVAELVEAVREGDVLPPVSVAKTPAGVLFLVDGFHRLAAARQLGQDQISADIQDCTRDDALWTALAANLKHGLRPSRDDKINMIRIACDRFPDKSNNEIIRHLKLPRNFFYLMLKTLTLRQVEGVGALVSTNTNAPTPPPSREGTDFRTWTMQGLQHSRQNLPQFRAPVPTPPPSTPSDTRGGDVTYPNSTTDSDAEFEADVEARGDEDFAPPPPPVRRPPAHMPPPVRKVQGEDDSHDALGQEVPPERLDTWGRRGELDDLLRQTSAIRSALRGVEGDGDPLYASLNFSSVLMHLDNAYALLKAARPHVVCPACSGHGDETCRLCHGVGLIDKKHYELAINSMDA